MKSLVTIVLPCDRKGLMDPNGPFLVLASEPGRTGCYEDEPDVIAQFYEDEAEAKFEAEWIDGEWKIGKRILDS